MIEVFATNVKSRAKEGYGIDIISIMAIMEMIMEMMDGCFDNEEEFVQACKDPSRLQPAATNIYVRRHLRLRGRRNVTAASQAIFDECKVASKETLVGGFREVQGLFHPDVLDYDFDPTEMEVVNVA